MINLYNFYDGVGGLGTHHNGVWILHHSPRGTRLNPPDEVIIAQKPETAVEYARYYVKARWQPGEAAIATNAKASCTYAIGVLKQRFVLGEQAIAKDSTQSVIYAMNIIGGRWEPGEAAILTDVYDAIEYAIDVLGVPWPEAEPIINALPKDDSSRQSYYDMVDAYERDDSFDPYDQD